MIKRLDLPSLDRVSVALLAENTARGAGICGEHGLSYWIEVGNQRVWFDLGQGMVLSGNAERLNIDVRKATAIVLSHGHYDHVGGFPLAMKNCSGAPLYYHPDALKPKYQLKADGRMQTAGDPSFGKLVKKWGGKIHETEVPTEIIEGVWVTGSIPRETEYEDTGGAFYTDREGTEPDLLRDDQAVFFKTEEGVVVVLGCAHSGVINTLRYINKLTESRIHAVIGGMHLVNANEHRIERTLEDLKEINPDWIGPNHCTGDQAAAALRMAFTPYCLECHAGQTVYFPQRITLKQD